MNDSPPILMNGMRGYRWVSVYTKLTNDSDKYSYDIAFLEDFCQTYSLDNNIELYLLPMHVFESGKNVKGCVVRFKTDDQTMSTPMDFVTALSDKFKLKKMTIHIEMDNADQTFEFNNIKI